MDKIDKLFLQSTLLHAKFFEVWLPVKGYTNYEVSSKGRVRNTTTMKILRPGKDGGGYLHVNLFKNRKSKTHKIHRLVARAYCPNAQHKPCVDHTDRNRINNNVANLRWCTNQENCRNVSMYSNNSSGIVGVSWYKPLKKWAAGIRIDGIRKHLGYFDSKDAAKRARIRAVNRAFGDFANATTNK